MWDTDTYWFDVARASFLLMLRHLYFGKFEQHRPYWRRLAKSLLGIAMLVMTIAFFGRMWSWALIGLIGVALIVVHGWWLPKNGVHGLTAEPRDRYFELIALASDGKTPLKRGKG